MKYYKAIKDNRHDNQTGYYTVANELLTERERVKHFPTLNENCFEVVNISCRKTYFCFGARFECSAN